MKKLSIFISLIILFAGCLKDEPNVDFSQIFPTVEIINGGLEYFTSYSLDFGDSVSVQTFTINVASVNPLDRNISVSVDLDTNLVASYNAQSEVQYEVMPDSLYSFTPQTVTIAAGTRQAAINITFYPIKADRSVNYLLPVSITDADGITISSNFKTVYYHTIGNCIAGTYDVTGQRTAYIGPVSDSIVGAIYPLPTPKTFLPLDPSTVEADYADLGTSGWKYVITVDCNKDSITEVSPNDVMSAGITPGSFKIYAPPTYDAVNGVIHIISGYTNTTGNDRIIDETFTKQ